MWLTFLQGQVLKEKEGKKICNFCAQCWLAGNCVSPSFLPWPILHFQKVKGGLGSSTSAFQLRNVIIFVCILCDFVVSFILPTLLVVEGRLEFWKCSYLLWTDICYDSQNHKFVNQNEKFHPLNFTKNIFYNWKLWQAMWMGFLIWILHDSIMNALLPYYEIHGIWENM